MPAIISADTTPANARINIVNHGGKPNASLQTAKGPVKQKAAEVPCE